MKYFLTLAVCLSVITLTACKEDVAPEVAAQEAEAVMEKAASSDVEPLQVPKIIYQDQLEGAQAESNVEITSIEPAYDNGGRIRKANGEEIFYHLELMLTPKQQQNGMMFREPLLANHGMIFIFEELFTRSFWMKNVFYPLDMLFIGPDGVIHHIEHMAEPQSETMISAAQPSRAVLELNGGEAKARGIAVGDVLVHNAFTSKK